jgi:hypothetical protein
MNTRTLGTLCIVGGIIAVLDALRLLVFGLPPFDTLSTIAHILWSIGSVCGLVGMIRLNVVGASAVVRALAFVPIIGFLLLILGGILELATPITPETDPLAGIAWLVQLAGMLLIGILTIAAKTWHGWRRFAPLLCIVLAPVALSLPRGLGTPFVFAAWVLLGYVVATATYAPGLRHAPAV